MAELEKLRNQGGDGGAYKSRTAATRTVHTYVYIYIYIERER